MMTRKDFKMTAGILKENVKGNLTIPEPTQELIIKAFINWFKADNPKFEEQRFREAVN